MELFFQQPTEAELGRRWDWMPARKFIACVFAAELTVLLAISGFVIFTIPASDAKSKTFRVHQPQTSFSGSSGGACRDVSGSKLRALLGT